MKGFTTLLAAAGLVACAQGAAFDLTSRTIPAKGGWSLQMDLTDTCPSGTSTCFSNLTGVYSSTERTGVDAMFNRGNECCPEGTTPRLDCGTYVNVGQPYACCPLDNPDCRGEVESPSRNGTEQCANTGWALWYIPDGDYNKFCCLPDHYGYWYKSLGQDAVGMCSKTPVLPENSTPGVQVNNGDGSVSANGTQLIALPVPAATPAPTCDIVHYGWSLQVDNADECTDESNYCSYGGSCCPKGLSCGTVIGDSEVPVCCPPGNPDCRGDVEGLWPQVCADSSWALWHVNTNGNHFCCKPDQIGFNVPGNNSAIGFCGDAVPHGYMRSILDYVGDGSKPGSFAEFPCDSVPAPNASFSSIESAILHPAPTLNPVATNVWSNWSSPAVATIVKPWLETVYVCPPGASQTVAVIHSLSSGIPVTATSTVTSVPSGAIITTGPLPTGTGSSSSGSGSGSGSGSSGSSGSGSGSGSSGSGSSGSGSSGSGSSGSGSSGSGSSGSGSSGSGSSGSGSSGSGSSSNGSSGSVGTGTSSSTPAVFTAGASFQSASLSVVLGLFAVMLWL